MVAISAEKTNAIQAIFSRSKAVIGVIHCDPFPGSPKYRGKSVSDIVERALRDAENYISGGVHGLIIENHGDIPFSKPEDIGHETSALMAVITEKVRERFAVPLGINVLANAAIPAMAIALAGGADFVRVNQWANAYIANEGFIEGAAAKALRYRSMLRAEHIRVFADSHVKHGSHAIVADRSIQELTRDVDFFEADAVIATGQRTGDSATMAEIDEIRAATELPLLVGSGVTPANVKQILGRTQGVIVASTMKVDGVWWNDVELARGETFYVGRAGRAGGGIMEAFSERLLREHQPAWQAMQQHPFVTDIEQDRLPTVVFNRYLVFEGNFVATAIAIFALGVSKAPGIQQQRWLIGVLNALVDIQIAWFEQVLSARQIDPAEYPDDLPGVRRFRDGMLRTAHEGSYEQIVTLMFGAEWMYYFWCRRASEHYQSDADLRRWVEMHAEDEFYQQALWLKNELDRCAMALSENEKQALSALYGEVLQWEIDFHHAAYEE